MSPREIVTLARDLQGKSSAAVDEELRRRRCDAETRVAVRLEIRAQAAHTQERRGARMIAIGLATDTAEYRPNRPDPLPPELASIITRAGVDLNKVGGYTEAELDALLVRAGVSDIVQRVALKAELSHRGVLGQPRQSIEMGRLDGKTMRASTERPKGKLLLNADGTPRVLRSRVD